MRPCLVAAAVIVAAVSASPALAKGPAPKGLSANVSLTSSNGTTCQMTLTISYNVTKQSAPVNEFDWAPNAGLPNPYGGFQTYGSLQTKVTTTISFSLSNGDSVQYLVTAKYFTSTIGAPVNSNLVSCV